MSINDCSNEVSFKSAAVANSFENVPAMLGESVAQSYTITTKQSYLKPLLSTAAPLTCLV